MSTSTSESPAGGASTAVKVSQEAERLVTIRLTDEQADHLRRALIFDRPWDTLDGPDPRTREEFENLFATVTRWHDQLGRLGWEPVGDVREFEERADVLARAAFYLLETGGDDLCHPGDESPDEVLRRQLSTRPTVMAGYAIAEQLEVA